MLESSADTLCMQFIKQILDLLPTALTSRFDFFRTEAQLLVKNIENLTDDEACKNQLIPPGIVYSYC